MDQGQGWVRSSRVLGTAVASVIVAAMLASWVYAACIDPPGDINGNGEVNVVDIQCSLVYAFYIIEGAVGPEPFCVADPLRADANCDLVVNISDVVLITAQVIGEPLPLELDADQDGCVDACLLPICGDGVCETDEESGIDEVCSCAADCGDPCGDGVCNCSEDFASCTDDCLDEAGACCIANGSPGCERLDASLFVCETEPSCCETEWVDECALLVEEFDGGALCTGDCCASNLTPGCDSTDDLACESCVCGFDEFCCESAWDIQCLACATGSALASPSCVAGGYCEAECGCGAPCGNGVCSGGETISSCPADCPGTNLCCVPSSDFSPGCGNTELQECVCAEDEFCCDPLGAWDTTCLVIAEIDCGGCTGPCCSGGSTAGCGSTFDFDFDCESAVCEIDAFCCDFVWDDECADIAIAQAGATCNCN